MSTDNVELARRGYEAVMRGDLDALAELLAPDLTWHWWEHGPWDCHSREEALSVVKERMGQRAIGELREVIDVGGDRVLVVMRRHPDSEVSYADLGVPEGHDEFANIITIRDGKVIAMHDYMSKADALAAVAEDA